jgi:hypothetical protein
MQLLLTRQIAQDVSSWALSEEWHLVSTKHFENTSSGNPVLTIPILSPRASSSCPGDIADCFNSGETRKLPVKKVIS